MTDGCVIGPIRIGNNCLIGAKALITKDIPSETLAYCKFELLEMENKWK